MAERSTPDELRAQVIARQPGPVVLAGQCGWFAWEDAPQMRCAAPATDIVPRLADLPLNADNAWAACLDHAAAWIAPTADEKTVQDAAIVNAWGHVRWIPADARYDREPST